MRQLYQIPFFPYTRKSAANPPRGFENDKIGLGLSFLGTSTLKLVGQLAQGSAEALGLGFIPVHDRILKQGT